MQTYISLLRGINVSGQKKIKMAELKALYQELGFENVRTYLQSGNVVFDSPEEEPSRLAGRIGAQIQQVLGYDVTIFILQPEDLQRILMDNPFIDRPGAEPNRLLVTFFERRPAQASTIDLSIPPESRDEFSVGEREIYLFCPVGYGKSKLSNNFIERKLGMPATTRNWRTVNALNDMAAE